MAAPDLPPLLELDGVDITYLTPSGAAAAVTGFSAAIGAGERVGLMGETGSGKTSIALAILRHLGPGGAQTAGRIVFRGGDMAELGPDDLQTVRGGDIAMVYQDPVAALNPSMTIGAQVIESPMRHRGLARDDAWALSREMLLDMHVPDVDRVMAAYPYQLSGGQCQRAVIAMALLGEPALLILDEPMTALDATVSANIMQLTTEISVRHKTAQLFISHDLGLIANTCDRVLILYAGEVVEEGPVREIFTTPSHPYTRALLQCVPAPTADRTFPALVPIPGRLPGLGRRPVGCRFQPRCAHAQEGVCDAGPLALEEAAPGIRVRCARVHDLPSDPPPVETAPASPPAGDEVLRVIGLRKDYPVRGRAIDVEGPEETVVRANDSLHFSARAGETVAIVGESGGGKTTFARILAGLTTATEGAVRLGGDDVAMAPVEARTPDQVQAIQMVFQNPDQTLNPSISVGRQIARAVKKLGGVTGAEDIAARVDELLGLVRLDPDVAGQLPHRLSGGERQRVAIARAFAANPALVVADEPLSALDPSVKAAVGVVLRRIQAERGSTLILISHDLGMVRHLAGRVVVMYLGRIVETGATEEIFAPPYHPYTEALIAAVPVADPRLRARRIFLEGPPPGPGAVGKGCPFHARCPRTLGRVCETEAPPLQKAGDTHYLSCHVDLDELNAVEAVVHAGNGDPNS